jgi:hypothetical protein
LLVPACAVAIVRFRKHARPELLGEIDFGIRS